MLHGAGTDLASPTGLTLMCVAGTGLVSTVGAGTGLVRGAGTGHISSAGAGTTLLRGVGTSLASICGAGTGLVPLHAPFLWHERLDAITSRSSCRGVMSPGEETPPGSRGCRIG